jgi:hypothetical protein
MTQSVRRDGRGCGGGHQTATFFLDESGSRASGSRFFVFGGIKTRNPRTLTRAMRAVRDRTGFAAEF